MVAKSVYDPVLQWAIAFFKLPAKDDDVSSVSSSNNCPELELAISELRAGASALGELSIGERIGLVNACITNVANSAESWVEAVCNAKRIAIDQPIASEEILVGPTSLLRYLRLLSKTLQDFQNHSAPRLPAKPRTNSVGRTCVPILPVNSLYDSIVFMGLKAEVWLNPDNPGKTDQDMFDDCDSQTNEPKIAGVLGAGNVSSIPATDMLHKIFREHQSVLLKLNPVNEYLEPIFNSAFAPLIEAKLLRVMRGGGEVGKAIVDHPDIDSIHITGSHITHEAIVWGSDEDSRQRRRAEKNPVVTKAITSELGNVSPWIVVPGKYSRRQLKSQAEHMVASITNNASFNCLATKMIVTSKNWAQRTEFLDLIQSLLKKVPDRFAYYPGAAERFAKATGRAVPENTDGTLPWTLIRNADPQQDPHLFAEESFVCVCAETALDSTSDKQFLESAVAFANERLFGTLNASITIPNQFRRLHIHELNQAIEKLRYGSVCINQWSGINYGLMAPPWGGHPGATLENPESGIGHVHNTFWLKDFEKSVLWGPLWNLPKPVWFASNNTANKVAWALFRIYEKPSLTRLPKLLWHAVRG